MTPAFTQSLFSVSKFNESKKAVTIFNGDDVIGVKRNEHIDKLLAEIRQTASRDNLLHFIAPLRDGLYQTTHNHMRQHEKQHRCSAAIYQTARLATLPDLVLFFHQAWGCANVKQMHNIVAHKLYDNIPKQLTPSIIAKYFPHDTCISCTTANLAARALPGAPEDRIIPVGAEIQIDIKGKWTGAAGQPVPTFSGNLYTLTAFDMGSDFLFGWTMRSKRKLLQKVKYVHQEVINTNRVLEILRVDNEFFKPEIIDYCATCVPPIQLLPCIPYEKQRTRSIERAHRSLQEGVVKAISNKPHITEQFWGMAFTDTLFKINLHPRLSHPTTTPYETWHGRKMDLKSTPLIPFGTMVQAHVPLSLQTALSGRSFPTYAVGTCPNHRGGILLFNPRTMRTIVRRSFKLMAVNKQMPQNHPSFIPYDTEDRMESEEYDDSDPVMPCEQNMLPSTGVGQLQQLSQGGELQGDASQGGASSPVILQEGASQRGASQWGVSQETASSRQHSQSGVLPTCELLNGSVPQKNALQWEASPMEGEQWGASND